LGDFLIMYMTYRSASIFGVNVYMRTICTVLSVCCYEVDDAELAWTDCCLLGLRGGVPIASKLS
jgi:hypothetical protein